MPLKCRSLFAARLSAPARGLALLGLMTGASGPALAQSTGPAPALRLDSGAADDLALGVPPSPGTNYGKPLPKPDPRKAYSGRRKAYAHALPPLGRSSAPSAGRGARTESATTDTTPAPAVAVVPPIPTKPRPKVEANPYAPVGIGVGSLRLTPYVSVDGGYDSNPNQSTGANVQGSRMLRGEIGGALVSDWSVHQLKGEFRAGYSKFTDVEADRPDAQGRLGLRLDATRDTAFDFELRGVMDTQRPGSPELTATSLKSRPIEATYGGSTGVTQQFNRLEVGLHGTMDRTIYQDATQLNGVVLPLSENNYTDYGAKLRLTYEATPGVKPFVEAIADARRRDQPIDSSGFARDSNGIAARVGSTFEITRTLTGEAAAGYAQRVYADARLPHLAGPTVDASLIWSASPLTTVTLKAVTLLSETTVANAAGSINHTIGVEISHALLRNLTLTAVGAVGLTNYQGVTLNETTWTGAFRAEYNLTRSISVRGSFAHQRLQSSAPGSDYTANVFLLGLKLQR